MMIEQSAHLDKVKAALEPSFLEQYELQKVLGSGAMGMVVQAYQKELHRDVAIKFIIECDSGRAELLKRFKREAQAMASMRHPNVCPLFDYGVSNGNPYLVTELLHGRPLNEHMLRLGKLPLEEAVSTFRQIAAGLACAHELGITHRDLKPANVFVCDDNRVMVVDFGLVSTVGAQTQLTKTGTVLGTPLYMSPEQVTGIGITTASDIFSMGIIAYEMFTGRQPSTASSMLSLLKEKLQGAWTPLRKLNPPDVPKHLCQLVDECMALEVDDRPNAKEVVKRLTPANTLELDDEVTVVPVTVEPPKPLSMKGPPLVLLMLALLPILAYWATTNSSKPTVLHIKQFKAIKVNTTSADFAAEANKSARAQLTITNSLDGQVITRQGQGAMKSSWHFKVNGLPPGTALRAILSLTSQGKNLTKSVELMTDLLEAKKVFDLPYQELPETERRISDVPIISGERYFFNLAKGYLGVVDLLSGELVHSLDDLPPGNLRGDASRLYHYGRDFEMRAFSQQNLKLIWKTNVPKKGYAARFFVDETHILLRLNEGGYMCLDKKSGREKWRVLDPFLTRPYHCGGGLLVTNHLTSGRLPFWDLETGKRLPKSKMNQAGMTLTLTRYYGGEFYLGLVPHQLLVGDPRKGIRLDIDTPGLCDQLSVSGERIVLLTNPATLTCYGRTNGKKIWQVDIEKNTPDSYLRCDGRYVFMMHKNDSFVCWDIESGRKLFQWNCNFDTPAEVVCHGNDVIFSADGSIQRMTVH